jgi:hypothetical protein
MKIKIKGLPLKRRKLFREACNFFCKSLMSDTILKELYVYIVFDKDLLKNKKLFGTVERSEENPKRSFKVQIQIKDSFTMLRTLAHELVHVKQYAHGVLKDLDDTKDKFIWKGKNRNYGVNPLQYYKTPWEMEAFSLEIGLVGIFLQETDRTNLLNKKVSPKYL